MEVKSRYEVVAELEDEKRKMIREREGLDNVLLVKKKQLRDLKREVEDKEQDIQEFEDSMEKGKLTINTLIQSLDDSLKRFVDIQKKN